MKTHTKYKDPKRSISGKSHVKGKKIEQESNFLKRKTKRTNILINESSIEKVTMEISQKYQTNTNNPMKQKKVFTKFPKNDEQEILKVFRQYGKLKIIKKKK